MLAAYITFGAIGWFYLVDATWDPIYNGMALIPPEKRKLTKHKSVRGLMLLGSLITLIVLLVLLILKSVRKFGAKARTKAHTLLISDLY